MADDAQALVALLLVSVYRKKFGGKIDAWAILSSLSAIPLLSFARKWKRYSTN
jgi:hypothetical protein